MIFYLSFPRLEWQTCATMACSLAIFFKKNHFIIVIIVVGGGGGVCVCDNAHVRSQVGFEQSLLDPLEIPGTELWSNLHGIVRSLLSHLTGVPPTFF